MIEHDRRQIRAAFRDVECKSALMIGESPAGNPSPIHHAFHEGCPSRERAVRLGFDDNAFELSVRINPLSSPPHFIENPEPDGLAVERIELALRLACAAELKIICCFGVNAKLALSAALKPERQLDLYHFSAGEDRKPPWIYCFRHPSPSNPIWKADNAAKTRAAFSDQASLTSRRIVSIGRTKLNRARKAAAAHFKGQVYLHPRLV